MKQMNDDKFYEDLQAKARAEELDPGCEESLTDYDSDYDSDYDDLLEELEELSASNKKWKKKLRKRLKKLKKRLKKLKKRYDEGQQSIVSRLDHLEQFTQEMPALLERAFQTGTIPLRSDSLVGVPITGLLNMLLICADRQRVDTTRLSLDHFQQSLPDNEYLNWEEVD